MAAFQKPTAHSWHCPPAVSVPKPGMHLHASELVLRTAPSVLLKPPTLAQDAQSLFPKSVLKESASHSSHCCVSERLKPALQRK